MTLFTYLTSIFLITLFKFTKHCLYTICSSSRNFWWVQCADSIAFSGSSRVFYFCQYLYITMLRIVQNIRQECSTQFYLHESSSRMFFNNLARVLNFRQNFGTSKINILRKRAQKVKEHKNFTFHDYLPQCRL